MWPAWSRDTIVARFEKLHSSHRITSHRTSTIRAKKKGMRYQTSRPPRGLIRAHVGSGPWHLAPLERGAGGRGASTRHGLSHFIALRLTYVLTLNPY